MPKPKNDSEKLYLLIGANIRRLRKSKRLTQYDLAIRCDIDRSYLGYIENAKFNVTLAKLCNIANVLEVNILELFKED